MQGGVNVGLVNMDKSNDNSHALPRLNLGVHAKNKRPDLWISPRWRFSSARGWPTSARRATSRGRGGCSLCPNSPTVATEERFPLPAVLPSFPPSQGFLRTDKFFVDQTHHERIAEILPTCQLPCRPKGRAFSSDWFFCVSLGSKRQEGTAKAKSVTCIR